MENISATIALNNTFSSSTESELLSKVEGIALCSTFIIEAVLIVVGNLLTIVLFLLNQRLRKKSLILVINMAVADLILGAVFLPARIVEVGDVYNLWTKSVHNNFYIFLNSVDTIFLQASLLSAALISMERFYAIYWPLKRRTHSIRAYRIIIFVVWTICIIVSTIFIVLSLFTTHKHAIYALIIYLSILLIIVCSCNVGIWRKFQHRSIASQQQNRALQNQRLTKTLLFVSAIALLSWFPVLTVNYLRFQSGSYISSPTIFFTAVGLNFANSFINPIVYALRIPEFRQALRLCCFGRQGAINIEGNRRGGDNREVILLAEINTDTTTPSVIQLSPASV